MKLVLMGTSEFVVPIFDRIAGEHDVEAVFTRAPKPAGRKMELKKSAVHQWADLQGLPVFTSIKDYQHNPDFVVVISYGVILKDDVLKSAPCINIHPSLLPKYRGPSPMQTALLNGDTETGVCLMQIVQDVDAGDILMMHKINLGENDTNSDLEQVVSDISADMLSNYLKNPDKYLPIPQVGVPTFSKKFKTADMIIDWNKSPCEIHNQVRAIGGRTKINGMDVKILETTVTDNNLNIIRIQPAGKKVMDWKSFVNGLHGANVKLGQ